MNRHAKRISGSLLVGPMVLRPLASWLALSALVTLMFTLSACGARNQIYPTAGSNKTGFTDPEGRVHTGAGRDNALDRVKQELAGSRNADGIESFDKADRELAAQILGAKLEEIDGKKLKIHLRLRDQGSISFELSEKDIVKLANAQSADVRYGYVEGKLSGGKSAPFELALLCRHLASPKEGERRCATALVSMKETHGAKAKAGLIIRHQDVTVIVRAPKSSQLRSAILKRLVADYQQLRNGTLQTFEVAWGPSGFDLNMHDQEICPSGRLVETNDLDEPLRLACPSSDERRELEGRMIGNTTRGELFLEVSATSQGFFGRLGPESVEHVFVLVRQKKAPKETAKEGKLNPPEEPEEPEDDDLFTDDSNQGKGPPTPLVPGPHPPASTPPSNPLRGWLVPIDLNNPVTKHWAKDRHRPLVAKRVEEWKASNRFKNFAINFLPNRDLVYRSLQQSRVPGEFAFITLIESQFFIKPGYPLEISSSLALGPWQFLPSTATDSRFGLRILPLVPVKNEQGRVIRSEANPCDERADLSKASVAAGKYFRVLLNMFPNDPRLAVAAYNWGEGNVECIGSTSTKCNRLNQRRGFSQDRLGEIRELGLNFWAIHRFNMAPSTTLNYVIDFMAAHHAALEMEPLSNDKNIGPWKPSTQCGRP